MKDLKSSIILIFVFTFFLGFGYPFAVWAVAQLAFPFQANGSLIVRDGVIVGSELLGQKFDGDGFFHGRLSANSYDAANSGGTNYGPMSEKLLERVKTDAAALGNDKKIPADLVTASASGLDPHISPAAAEFQIPRVAKARTMTEEQVRALVVKNTEDRDLKVFGEKRVNVLKLNLELMQSSKLEIQNNN